LPFVPDSNSGFISNGSRQQKVHPTQKPVTVSELAAEFLDHAKANINPTDYMHYQTVILDFLEKLYGDNFPVDGFKPRCLERIQNWSGAKQCEISLFSCCSCKQSPQSKSQYALDRF